MINTDKEQDLEKQPQNNKEKPDDFSSMYIRNFLKIIDPESGETILETAN